MPQPSQLNPGVRRADQDVVVLARDELLATLSELRRRDASFSLFGALGHRYVLNDAASPDAVSSFEETHHIRLPDDYREFLLSCGNGGAGPYYGVFPLGQFDGSGSGLESWHEGDGFAGVLRLPFPHTSAWNLADARYSRPEDLDESAEDRWFEELDAETWAPELTNGAFPICHQGCAYRNLLVVSGPERGHIWLDARASDQGLLPVSDPSGNRVTFASWYLGWLDAGLDGREYQ